MREMRFDELRRNDINICKYNKYKFIRNAKRISPFKIIIHMFFETRKYIYIDRFFREFFERMDG